MFLQLWEKKSEFYIFVILSKKSGKSQNSPFSLILMKKYEKNFDFVSEF